MLHLKVDTSLSIDIYFMSVRQVYTEFCAQVHGDRDGRKPHPECFHYFTKAQCFVVIVNKRRVFTDSEGALLLPV